MANQTTTPSTFIRFNGILRKNMTFRFKPGWETAHISVQPRETSFKEAEYAVDLKDEKGKPILSVFPEVKFNTANGEGDHCMPHASIACYVPLHPSGRTLTFRRGDYIIHERNVAKVPPTVEITKCTISKKSLSLKWKAKGEGDKLFFNISWSVDKQKGWSLARNITDTAGTFDVSGLPTGNDVRVAVIVSDGLRSGYAVSERLDITNDNKGVFILKPGQDELFGPDQPITFVGRGFGEDGETPFGSQLAWSLDGKPIETNKKLGMITDLSPGKHELVATLKLKNKAVASKKVEFEVAPRSTAQQRFHEQFAPILRSEVGATPHGS